MHPPEQDELKAGSIEARRIRLIFQPRKGTAVYLAKLESRGLLVGFDISPRNLLRHGIEIPLFTSPAFGDANRDGEAEITAASEEGSLRCLNINGEPLWKSELGGRLRAVACVDFAGTNRATIVTGGDDTTVHHLDGNGKPLRSYEIPFYKRKPVIETIFTAPLHGARGETAIIGADNWRYYDLDGEANERWQYESVHDATVGTAADLDGDGRDEILAGTVYYWWQCINPDGTRRWCYSSRTGPGVSAVAVGNFDADAVKEVIFAGKDGNLHVLDDNGKQLFLFRTGEEITGAAAMDLNGDGRDEIIATSMNFNLFAIDASSRQPLWRRELPDVATALALADLDGDSSKEICAACSTGAVYCFSLKGDPFAVFRCDVDVIGVSALPCARGAQMLLLRCRDGTLRLVGLK